MLLLFFKTFWWAAWWPYYTMLLALEKAASQAADRHRRRPEPQAPAGETAHRSESSMAANEAFMTPEVPQAVRELMKTSIEHAKRAFEIFISTSEKTWTALENISPSGRASLHALNAKIAEITRLHAEANFALAVKLAETKDLAQAMELQTEHVKRQMETFVRQLEEMHDLAAQIIQDANPATQTGAGNLRSASGGASLSSSSYAPSSSFTPGETGRTY